MRLPLPAAALAILLASAQPALAQVVVPPALLQDQVTLVLTVEDWVRAESAKVSLVVEAAGQGAEAATLRDELVKVARGIADKADWRIVALDRQPDSAGLDRWRAVLEARLPEAQLANLADRTKKASRPGLQVQIGAVEFEPTLAELEAARSTLRATIYQQVTAELERLKAAFPDRAFRVGRVDFQDHAQPKFGSQEDFRVSMATDAAGAPMPVQSGVQDKLTLIARVTLASFAPPPKP